jgi:hypothetical protein
MKKIFSILFLLCFASNVFAGGAASNWNDSWGFQTPLEKSHSLGRAMAMEFVNDGGFEATYNSTSNDTYFQEQHCDAEGSCGNFSSTAIGNVINVDGDSNTIDSSNNGEVESDTELYNGYIDNSQDANRITNRNRDNDNGPGDDEDIGLRD